MLEDKETKQQTKCHCIVVAIHGKTLVSLLMPHSLEAVLPQAKHNNMGMNKILNTSESFRGIFFLISLFNAASKLRQHRKATVHQRLNSEPTGLSTRELKNKFVLGFLQKIAAGSSLSHSPALRK